MAQCMCRFWFNAAMFFQTELLIYFRHKPYWCQKHGCMAWGLSWHHGGAKPPMLLDITHIWHTHIWFTHTHTHIFPTQKHRSNAASHTKHTHKQHMACLLLLESHTGGTPAACAAFRSSTRRGSHMQLDAAFRLGFSMRACWRLACRSNCWQVLTCEASLNSLACW